MMKTIKKEVFITGIVISAVFCLSLFNILPAQAAVAGLSLSPASGTYVINKNFTVKVLVNSGGGIGINASEGTIKYDPEYLFAAAVSESGSIFELWTAKPSYNNTSGVVSYGGGMPTAYTGNAGTILSITFTAKKIGETVVNISNGVVLAADGKGTNVLSGMGSGTYTIKAPEEQQPEDKPKPEEEKEEIKGVLPPSPEVTSPTHPVEDTWYSNNDPEIKWKLLSDISGVSYDLNKEADADPGNRSDGIIEFKVFENTGDGEWYFHIKYQNRVGWGKIKHRKVLIDATPPVLASVNIDNGGDSTNPTPLLKFKSQDETSGINQYKLILDTVPLESRITDFANGQYRFSPLLPGEHNLNFAVIDKANNAASSSLKFIVEPLKAPIISDIPKVITTKDELIIRGTSFYPQVAIQIYIAAGEDEPVVYETKTDDQGGWNYFHKMSLDKGVYQVWAKVVDSRGAQSLNSAKEVLTVIRPSLIELYGWLIILILIIIIILQAIYIIYQHESFKRERKRIKREVREAKLRLAEIFAALKEEVDELMELADKKAGLSESERRVKEKLQEALNISQEFLDKELEDVEKEIKTEAKGEK